MKKESCFYIGFISKKHGFKGDLSIKLNVDQPKEYLNLDFIHIEIEGQLIPHKITSCLLRKKIYLQVQLQEITNDQEVSCLIGKHVFIEKNKIKKSKNIDFFYNKIVGYRIENIRNEKIGIVKELNKTTLQTLMIIEHNNGQEIFIPLVKNFIKKIDEKQNLIIVDLPDGILKLNQKKI